MFLRVFLIKVQFYLHGRDREKIISLSLLILIKNREKSKSTNFYKVLQTLVLPRFHDSFGKKFSFTYVEENSVTNEHSLSYPFCLIYSQYSLFNFHFVLFYSRWSSFVMTFLN